MAGVLVCPRGHASTEADYCSECGAKLQGVPAAANGGGTGQSAAIAGQVCPDCGTVRERGDTAFCEVCGFNFVTGAHGEVPPAAAPVSVEAEPEPVSVPETVAELGGPGQAPVAEVPQWAVEVCVDPSLRGPESPEAPVDVAPVSVVLDKPVCLIGRRNEARAIFPEIALPHDEAVSRRHALLQTDGQGGLLLRDIGAANGTRLNGKELEPMVDYPVNDGDEITLGHWSRLRVQGR